VEILNDSFRGEGGFDFAIRTPCTPSRWDDFDAEMTMAWEVSQPSPKNSRPKLLACLLSCFRFSINFFSVLISSSVFLKNGPSVCHF
jgi:hypothetical protein